LPAETFVFHAGTKYESGKLVTDGGRVLSVVATEKNMPAAVRKCYAALDSVSFKGKDFRSDIARRGYVKCLTS
jgi:phosphoribosylamine--glycine ligase/phosphoribosylformylglycinamidine cyclo-ligase